MTRLCCNPPHAAYRGVCRPEVLAVALALLNWGAEAQAASPLLTDDRPAELSVVTVNARRAPELAKDVPFSVSVVSGSEAESRRLLSLDEMLRQTPGVDMVVNGGMATGTLRMRGVGALQKVSGDDSSVVINIDGLPLSPANASLNVLDVEQVEVLKGHKVRCLAETPRPVRSILSRASRLTGWKGMRAPSWVRIISICWKASSAGR